MTAVMDWTAKQLMGKSSEDMARFYNYVLSFYGDRKDAIYDYKFTMSEVVIATHMYIASLDSPDDFVGDDSLDRERVRDIVLDKLRK